MSVPYELALIECARIQREALARILERMASEQLGEAFQDEEPETKKAA